jgi:DNA invertase Pin-like site-specific DNA recombinase
MTSRRRAVLPAVPEASAGEPTDPKNCGIYTRKSNALRRSRPAASTEQVERTDRDQEFTSIDAQREAGELFVGAQAHRGWRVLPDRYDDGGYTGANLERPAFQRLMADVDAGKINVVVVYKVDRLSRSLLDFARVMERFQKAGVDFVSVTQNFSTADAIGRLTLNILMSFAEFERAMIAERTRDKIAASRRRGKWTGGAPQLGYDNVDRRLVVNEHEAVIVREIFVLYIEHRSIVAVLDALNERGRTTKRHQARSGHVRVAHGWTKDAVLRVLKNPLYAGLIRAGDTLVQGEHQAIIDRETFDRAQAILAGRAPGAAPVRNPEYLLRGLLRCACCEAAMTPASTRRAGREYRYYRCITRDKQGTDACPTKPMPAEEVENCVVRQIRAATSNGQLASDVAARLAQRIAEGRAALGEERRALPGAISRLAAEGRKLAETAGETDGAARRLVEDRLRELGEELGQKEARLAEVEQQLAALQDLEVEGAWVERALRDFDTLWGDLTLENRVRLVRAVVTQVVLDEPGERITVHLADLSRAVPDNASVAPA